MTNNDLCAVILAGGQSRRMGCNKALLDMGGKPLISVLVDRIRPLTDRILISSNDVATYRFLNFPVVPDVFAGQGPLAGLHSAMLYREHTLYLVLACDLPNLQPDFLRNLVALSKGFDAAIPRTCDGLVHPLCAVYRRSCLPTIELSLARGANKVIEIFLDGALVVRLVDPDEANFKDTDLANINTPEDLRRIVGAAAR